MTPRSICGAIAIVVFGCGLVAAGAAQAQQRRDGNLLPQAQSGEVVVAGCLVRGSQIRGGEKERYILALPKKGPVDSVPDGSCSADAGADALDIDNEEKGPITDAALGRWVEIRGRLERETSTNPDNLRELDVAAFRLLPVVPPRAAAAPAPAPAPAARPAPPVQVDPPAARVEPAPAAPARELPRTASPVPMVGLAGVLLLTGGLALRSFRSRGQE